MNFPEEIILEHFTLRKLKYSDASSITKHITRDIVRYVSNIPYPYTEQHGKDFVQRSRKNWKNKTELVYGIEINNQIVGICSLTDISQTNRHATIGYWLAQEYWGKKIITQAATKIVEIAFITLNLHRITAECFEENLASKHIIEKLDFSYEGTKRDALYRENHWHNILCYSLLETEYKK